MRLLMPPGYFLLAVIIAIALHYGLPVARLIQFPWNLLGILPFMVGAIFGGPAVLQFLKCDTTIRPFHEANSLVTTGVYRFSRNPMYLSLLLMSCGIVVFLGSLTPFIVIPLLFMVLDRVFIEGEERMMEERFGEEFREYKKRVRRWI